MTDTARAAAEAFLDGCENSLDSAGGFKWRAIKLIALCRELLQARQIAPPEQGES